MEPFPFRLKLNYEKGNYLALKNYLGIDWEKTLKTYNKDVNNMWNFFEDLLINGTNQFVPRIKKCI